jgi:inorganic pyrophosphatase
MANINHKPSKFMLNLQHVLESYADEDKGIVNGLMEINSNSINKYEYITETGILKLDRVGYSSLALFSSQELTTNGSSEFKSSELANKAGFGYIFINDCAAN